ncbi:hypothetical protein EB008_06450 [bacterium]|jgi:hypothetical protein|nr:hypothetical protein [bacterium]
MPTVKKVAATSDAARAEANARSTRKTKAAKSGATARLMASAERYLEKNEPGRGNKKTIKVNSNPIKSGKTKVSPMAKVRKPGNFRGRGGAIGGGFLEQIK